MPSLGDIHQDHETIAARGHAGLQAHHATRLRDPLELFQFRQQAYVAWSRATWTQGGGAALLASQQHRNYANEEYIRNLARTHGIESGRELAEVFEVYRWVPVTA